MQAARHTLDSCYVCGRLGSTALDPAVHLCSFRCLSVYNATHKENSTMPSDLYTELNLLTREATAKAVADATRPDSDLVKFCISRCRDIAKQGEGAWFLTTLVHKDRSVRDTLAATLRGLGLVATESGQPGEYLVSWGEVTRG